MQITFKDQLKTLVFFYLEEHAASTHLVQFLKQDDFVRECTAPKDGITKSSFFEAVNSRGLEQLNFVFNNLQEQTMEIIPQKFKQWGELVTVDNSLMDAVFSIIWTDYRNNAKIHFGFNINHSILTKLFLTKGLKSEWHYVSYLLTSDQSSMMQLFCSVHQV